MAKGNLNVYFMYLARVCKGPPPASDKFSRMRQGPVEGVNSRACDRAARGPHRPRETR